MQNNGNGGPSVTYILGNNMGGITTMLDNIIRFRHDRALDQDAIILDIKEHNLTKITDSFGDGIPVTYFGFSKKENWYSIYGRLARQLEGSEGVIVANDAYEMVMLSHYNVAKKVVQVIHDAYNVKLAVQYGETVDAFVCHTIFYFEVMRQLFSDRRNDIYHIPYGVPVNGSRRQKAAEDAPLKLVFLGRHDKMKGIFDLFEIEKLLQAKGIAADWLILGKGPETEELHRQWAGAVNVKFVTPPTNEEVLRLISERDVLVFPTKFEGFPVALVEAMSRGLVPVASDLPGGLRELVKNDHNGFLCPLDDNRAFADRIAYLHHHRDILEAISTCAYDQVSTNFNAVFQSPRYQDLFTAVARSGGIPRHHSVKVKLGSRLDQPWLPNSIVRRIRKLKY
jgi:glycosyltransferase involved in cell wall biosynthesis